MQIVYIRVSMVYPAIAGTAALKTGLPHKFKITFQQMILPSERIGKRRGLDPKLDLKIQSRPNNFTPRNIGHGLPQINMSPRMSANFKARAMERRYLCPRHPLLPYSGSFVPKCYEIGIYEPRRDKECRRQAKLL